MLIYDCFPSLNLLLCLQYENGYLQFQDARLFLTRGAGAPTLIMESFFENNDLRRNRDIVLMDQRGTGRSNAICDDFGSKMFNVLAKT